MGLAVSSSNIKVGSLREIRGDDIEGSVFELDDGKFPNFYFDHSNHVAKVDSWLKKIQICLANNILPLPPAVIVDSPKSGKTTLLTRIIPSRIRTEFPSAIILFLDFLTISTANNHHVDSIDVFVKVFIEYLVQVLKDFGFYVNESDGVFNLSVSIQSRLKQLFSLLNGWLSKKGCLCFMIWDEIQRWFQLNNSNAGAIFNHITLHAKFSNIVFAVTGSSMVTVLESIVHFPSNGTSWIAEATQISVYPQMLSDSVDRIASQADERAIAFQMFQLLQQYHPDTTPNNLLDYVCDSNPAVLAYFCQLHKSNNSNPGSMKATLYQWYEKLWNDFLTDSLPILQMVQVDDPEVLSLLLHIASETLSIHKIDFSSLGTWRCLFEPILRQTQAGKVVFVGYYGYLIMRCCEVQSNGELKIKKSKSPNKLPIPALWSTVQVISEILNRKTLEDRTKANKISEDIIKKGNNGMPVDFVTDPCFLYFLTNHGDKSTFDSSILSYLHFLKYIRNSISHIKSLNNINQLYVQMPMYLSEWVRVLMETFVL